MHQNESKVINTLFDSLKDFIVIGLCGKNGSGSSTAADILQTDFSALKLPVNNPEKHDEYSEHEYKLLCTFAEKNWGKFSRIKTSALITAHVLETTYGELKKFLLSIHPNADHNSNDADATCTGIKVSDEMTQSAPEETVGNHSEAARNSSGSYMANIGVVAPQETSVQNDVLKICKDYFDDKMEYTGPEGFFVGGQFKVEDIEIPYEKKGNVIKIRNEDLYKLFGQYGKSRREKKLFYIANNPEEERSTKILFEILTQYIYDFLPKSSKTFWDKISNAIQNGIPTIAMQILGVNLRISRKPYANNDIKKCNNGYYIIAEDINLAIKLLRGL